MPPLISARMSSDRRLPRSSNFFDPGSDPGRLQRRVTTRCADARQRRVRGADQGAGRRARPAARPERRAFLASSGRHGGGLPGHERRLRTGVEVSRARPSSPASAASAPAPWPASSSWTCRRTSSATTQAGRPARPRRKYAKQNWYPALTGETTWPLHSSRTTCARVFVTATRRWRCSRARRSTIRRGTC